MCEILNREEEERELDMTSLIIHSKTGKMCSKVSDKDLDRCKRLAITSALAALIEGVEVYTLQIAASWSAHQLSKARISISMASANASIVRVRFLNWHACDLEFDEWPRLHESAKTEDRKCLKCSSVVATCARDDKIASCDVNVKWARHGVSCVV